MSGPARTAPEAAEASEIVMSVPSPEGLRQPSEVRDVIEQAPTSASH